MKKIISDQHAMDVALARYAVIAPLVSRNLSREEYRKERAKVLACTHKFPGEAERVIYRRTVERWLGWYRHGRSNDNGVVVTEPGLEALKPVPRTDHGSVRVLPVALIEQAARLRMEDPRRSTQTIVSMLKTDFGARGEGLAEFETATLAYHLRARRLTRRHLKQEGRAYPRYEHPYRNAVWQGDWTQGILLPDPTHPNKQRMCHLHAFIDDHTRYLVHGEFYFRQNLPCLEDCFRKAILKGGIPQCAYWDNGAVYHARQVKLLAGRLGIQIIFATPYAPEGKGKIERFFRTLKNSFYPEAMHSDLKTLDELNTFFWGWLDRVYHATMHSEIQQTPLERWQAGSEQVRMPEPGLLVDLFLWEETRQVDKSGCVQLGGNHYPVGEHMVGQGVEVRFDPFDLSVIRVYHRGDFVETASPLTLVSHTLRKAMPKRADKVAPLESSTAYCRQISQSYRREIATVMEQSRQPGEKPNECLTRTEFVALLSTTLERGFTVAEVSLSTDFFQRYAPMRAQLVTAALRLAVDEKGAKRHLRFYLDVIRDLRLRRELN
jgi:putative transposase